MYWAIAADILFKNTVFGMRMYIVKTEDGYLYLNEGAVSFTDEERHAGRFPTQDEGHIMAQMFGYVEGRYRIIPTEK